MANGSFLLNAAMVNRARQPLAVLRVTRWAGDEPLNVAFVEGSFVLAGDETAHPSFVSLLQIPPFGWLAAQLLALGLAACLASREGWAAPDPIPPPPRTVPSRTPRRWAACWARTGTAERGALGPANLRAIATPLPAWRSALGLTTGGESPAA